MSAKVAAIDVAECEMPFAEGEWHFALGASSVKRGFFVRVVDTQGQRGWGYFGEIFHDGEIVGGALAVLARMGTDLLGRTPRALAGYLASEPGPYGNRRAKAAVETAAIDLLGRQTGAPPLQEFFGEPTGPSTLDVMRIVPLGTPQDEAEHARSIVNAGYRYLKLKADGHVATDVARVAAVRDAVGPGVRFIVDANQSFSPKAAVAFARAVAHLGVDIFEQPVHREDLDGLRFVRERSPFLVDADESVENEQAVIQLIRSGAVDGLSLKYAKLGGLINAVRIARMADAAGLTVRIGAAFGSRLNAAANLHLAGHIVNGYAAEIGEFDHLSGDPVLGLEVENGQLAVPEGPGLGLDLEIDETLNWRPLND